ncbi:MAG: peptide chain release factor N(5)-glutamine methyltransferase [Bacillota bacterium]
MATVGEALELARASLREDSQYPARDAVLLLAHALDKPTSYLHLHPEDTLSPRAEEVLMELVRRRKAGEPMAYIRGYQEFMGDRFLVDRRVLIPRPETEILVEAAVEELRVAMRSASSIGSTVDGALTIADICCGSGAIGLSLAKTFPGITILLSDVSPDALEVARMNAGLLGVERQARFLEGDLITPLIAAGWADSLELVTANPPYIAREEMDSLPRDVRCFEPRLALDGGPGGLDIIRRLAAEAPAVLKSGALFLMEIGHGQGSACEEIFSQDPRWRDPSVLPDYAGRQRVLKVRRK